MAKIKRFPLGTFMKRIGTTYKTAYASALLWDSGRVTPNLKQASVKKFARVAFADSSVIHSDGYRSYISALEGFAPEHRSYDPDSGSLHWLHIISSNARAFILGAYHGLSKEHLQSYLDEYSFRFNCRGFGGALVERLSPSIALSRSAEQTGSPQ